ncbi:hypothetical protein ACNF40_01350 [Cuniculiplasma sp. SKW4]|uniref:hypothetical protein n=1 Tax=Cuniculiplasma sp. SKW4 TaxID=3400171 RepID=UPI003FCFA689
MTPFIVYVVVYVSKNYSKMNNVSISVVLFLLSMMSGMLNSINYYIIFPNGFINNVAAFNISMFEMSVILSYLLLEGFNGNLRNMNPSHAKWFAVLVGWNEVSMAFLLYTLAYGFGTRGIYTNTLNLIGASVTNYLFLIPMIIEMLFVLLLRIHGGISRRIMESVILMQLADPALIGNSIYVTYGSVIFSIVMILVIYYVFSYAFKNRNELTGNWKRELNYFIFILVLSILGLIEPILISGAFGIKWLIFSISMVASMIYYFTISFKVFDFPDYHKRKNKGEEIVVPI